MHAGATLWELIGVCSRNFSGGTKDGTERARIYYDINRVKGYGVGTEVLTRREVYGRDLALSETESMLGTDQEHVKCITVRSEGLNAPLVSHVEPAAVRAAANKGPSPRRGSSKK